MKAQFEAFTPLPESSFRIFGYEVAEFDAPWHYHPEYELTIILKSCGIRYVGNSMESFEAGDLVSCLVRTLPHCWKNAPDNTGPGEFDRSTNGLSNSLVTTNGSTYPS